ncbi:MAG: nSTAND1 domain-containing NTPase [Anaerolineales bacterium]
MSNLEILLLGPFQVRLGGEVITGMRSDKVRALLAYLAVEADQPHRREKLAGLLWSGYPEESARASLRRALADLRAAINDERANPPYLQVTRQTIQFDKASDAWVDVNAFCTLVRSPKSLDEKTILGWEEAAALYRGEFIEGFSLPDSVAFEEWLLVTREQLERQELETLEKLVESLEQRGEHRRGLEHAWRAVELDPLRESAQRGLMRLLALSGQREAALAQYEACEKALMAALGVTPSVETRELHERILREVWPPAMSNETGVEIRPLRDIGACPYRGLAAFREQDAPYFFGRENFIQKVLELTQTRKVVAVILGSSGSGKSSVVYAGVIPRLRSQDYWLIAELRPGTHPFHSISGALLPWLEPELSETNRLVESQKLAAALDGGTLALHQLVERVLEKTPGKTRILLFIDQFEELYTLCPQGESRQSFLKSLLETIERYRERREHTFALLLTMRADFMGQALSHRQFADALQSSSLMLGPMTRDELRAAIEKPAELQGAACETGLVERILDDVGDERGNLPLLEFALTLLWENAQSGWLTHESYEDIGEIKGALARYAEQVYGELDDDDQGKAQRVFLQLVRPGEGTEDTRRVSNRAEIGDENWSLVQHLADKRLVVTGRDVAGNDTVEVVHEALIGNWDRLRSWIEAERTFRVWQEGLRVAIRQWEATAKDEGALLRGAPLAEAEAWKGTHAAELSAAELNFIDAGIDLREREISQRELLQQRELRAAQQLARSEHRRRNILLAFVAVLSIAAVAALLLTSFSLSQRREALQAYSASLAASAQQALDDGDTATALALAMAANTSDQPPLQAQRVVLDAAYSPGARQYFDVGQLFPDATGPATAIAISPDGNRALIGMMDGMIIVWDLASGDEITRLRGHSAKINDIGIDASGRLAVSVGDDALAIVWDLATTSEIHRFNGHSGQIRALDISRGGQLVVTAGFSNLGWEQPGELILWELGTGEEIRRFTGHVAGVVAAEFCLDDRAILASSGDSELFSSVGASDPQMTETMPRDMLLWDVESGEIIHNFNDIEHEAFTLSVSPNGRQALVGSYYEGLISSYDLTTYEHLATLEGHEDAVRGVVYGNEGLTAVSSSKDGTLILWDLLANQRIARLAVHTGDVLDVARSPDGRTALSSESDGALILWDLVDAAELRRFYGHGDMVYDVALSPESDRLLSSSRSASVNRPSTDTSIRLWDIETAQQLISSSVPLAVVFQVAVSPDGQAALYTGADPYIHIMDLQSWQETGRLEGHRNFIPCIEFLPDGKRAFSCSGDGTLILWDLQSGQPVYRLDGRGGQEGIWAVAISPGGDTALSDTSQGTMIMWDLQSGEELRTFHATEPSGWAGATGIAYLPDGKSAISVGGDGKIIQWDLESGEEIRLIGEHPALRTRIIVTPDGKLALTAGMDGRLMLWDLENGILIRNSDGHGVIFDLALSADGQTAFFGSSDTTIVEWRISNPSLDELKSWIEANRYVRPLTCTERELYQIEPLCESE